MAELRYPLKNIGPQDDYFKVQILEYIPPGLGLQGGNFALNTTEQALSGKKAIHNIILPMPGNIQDSNSADWSSGSMNPIQAGLTNAGAGAVLSGSPLDSVMQSLKQAGRNIGEAASSGEGQRTIAAGSAAAAVQALTGQADINSVISRATGQVFNQNVELLFTGVSIRPAFQFSFDMVPRSKKESNDIKEIIRILKQNMTPKKGDPSAAGGGLFVKAPNIFKLQYMSGGIQHPFLHQFKPCALTQMSVNYNGSGQYATYPDATPIHMQMSLQFQELSPIYSEDYDKIPSNQGVGY